MSVIYTNIKELSDISKINCMIRDEMLKAEDASVLTDLKKRSDYLVTLTYSPFWKKHFKDKIEKFRDLALKENRITVKLANYIAKYNGWDKEYNPWKKELNIDDELKQIPKHIINEMSEEIFTIKKPTEIISFLRDEFCDIRKAMVLCENQECIEKLKRANDILFALPLLPSFEVYFEAELLEDIKKLTFKESERVNKLANIVSEVNGWSNYYENRSFDEVEDNFDEYLKELLDEEIKSDTYIPTEIKYKKGASVLWIVYWHRRRKREFAKRVYFPKEFRIIDIEGPNYFVNRFKHQVYGLKIVYESKVKATKIRVRGREIKLPARWIKREKIVPLSKDALNIRIEKEKPKSAMSIA